MPRGVPTLIVILFTAAAVSVLAWWAAKSYAPVDAAPQHIVAGPADWQTLHVMTANIRLDDPSDGPNNWQHRRALAVETFLKYQPDILACQEVSPAQGAFLAKQLASWYAFYPRAGVGTAPASSQARGGAAAALLDAINGSLESLNTIYYRKDRFDILDGEAGLVIPEEPQRDLTENTYYTLAVLRQKAAEGTPGGDAVVVVIDVHLRHNEAFAARCAARVRDKLLAWEAKYPGSGGIVLGDMNHTRGSAVYRALTEAAAGKTGPSMIDVFDYSKPGSSGPLGTYHAFKGVAQGALPSDLIFASGSLALQEPARILDDHQATLWPSDHFFVMAGLKVEGAAQKSSSSSAAATAGR